MEAPKLEEADPGYYQTVEEFFVSRRGDPLFLSSADWTLVHKWRTEGIPLRVVLRGVADALESHAHSWSRNRKVGSLRYCAAEVESARERWLRALSLGTEAGSAAHMLEGFAEALDKATARGPRSQAACTGLARDLREWARDGLETRALEPRLIAREAELVAALGSEMGPRALEGLERAVDEGLAAYRGRMPEKVLAQVRSEGLTRRILEAHGLPRISLVLT